MMLKPSSASVIASPVGVIFQMILCYLTYDILPVGHPNFTDGPFLLYYGGNIQGQWVHPTFQV